MRSQESSLVGGWGGFQIDGTKNQRAAICQGRHLPVASFAEHSVRFDSNARDENTRGGGGGGNFLTSRYNHTCGWHQQPWSAAESLHHLSCKQLPRATLQRALKEPRFQIFQSFPRWNIQSPSPSRTTCTLTELVFNHKVKVVGSATRGVHGPMSHGS